MGGTLNHGASRGAGTRSDSPGVFGNRDLADRLAALVDSIGGDGFETRLTGLLTAAASFEQVNILALSDTADARCLFTWHRQQPRLTTLLVERYIEGRYYTVDPLLTRLRHGRAATPRMEFLRSEQIENAWYRSFFFDEIGLSGKMSVLEQRPSGGTYFNFYHGSGAQFSDCEIENLAWLSKVVSHGIARHEELRPRRLPPPDGRRLDVLSRLLRRRASRLTVRELAVCARIVSGYSSEAIALDLGIAESSVATYRKRSYAKLGICSQHELFSLCLEAARDGGE